MFPLFPQKVDLQNLPPTPHTPTPSSLYILFSSLKRWEQREQRGWSAIFGCSHRGNAEGTMGTVIGIDPGKVGAAVVVVGSRVLEVLTWDTADDIAPIVMDLTRRHGARLAVVEYTPKTRGTSERMSPASRVTFGRRAQQASSGARCGGAEVVEVAPADWRLAVLRLSAQTSGEAAKRAAMGACWGGVVRRLEVSLGLTWPDGVERSSHVAEASCLAVWGRDGYAGRVKRGRRGTTD